MRNRGSASVLAMIFLVVFSALACAFYVMINTSMQVGRNDRNSVAARSAAESGMQVIKNHLSHIKISNNIDDGQVMSKIYDKLIAIDFMGASNDFAPGGQITRSDNLITYPEMKLNPASGAFGQPRTFKAYLNGVNAPTGLRIDVAIDATDPQSKLTRSMAASFYAMPAAKSIFEYDLASPGVIYIDNGTLIRTGEDDRVNVMSGSSASPSIFIENGKIGGDLSVVVSDSQVKLGSGVITVDGVADKTQIQKDVMITDPPTISEYNTSRTSIFYDILKAKYGGTVPPTASVDPRDIGNGFIKADFEIAPSNRETVIAGDVTMNGLIYVRHPNRLNFRGNLTLNGVIIFEQPFEGEACTHSDDHIEFQASITQTVPTGLDPELVGYTILAPGAQVKVGGSTNIATDGSIICETFDAGSSGFDLDIHNGVILTLSSADPSMTLGQGTITFSGTPTLPGSGVDYFRHYVMDPKTYEERFQ